MRKAKKKLRCSGVHKFGVKKGKLKKGWKWARGQKCPVKVRPSGGLSGITRVGRPPGVPAVTAAQCVGLVSSGVKKGKLRPGYQWSGTGCPKKV